MSNNSRILALRTLNDALREREQRLIDMCFAIAMRAESLTSLDIEARAKWVTEQLGVMGFADLYPMGMSWGYLANDTIT